MLGEKRDDCVFCFESSEDEDRFVVWRERDVFILLNKYPYTNGHILVAPTEHVADPTMLRDDQFLSVMKAVQMGLSALRKAFSPKGFNVGMNLGEVAGAGVAEHFHIHLVPRWGGDTNFMTVLSGTRVLCQDLHRTAGILRDAFGSLSRS